MSCLSSAQGGGRQHADLAVMNAGKAVGLQLAQESPDAGAGKTAQYGEFALADVEPQRRRIGVRRVPEAADAQQYGQEAAMIQFHKHALAAGAGPALAQTPPTKPNIVMIVSDDFSYGDAGVYGGGAGCGMPTPNIDRMADEGMTFFDFYAQPSCTPGRAAMQSGRIPNRSGMTTEAFQGEGGGLPAAEWTLASALKTAGCQTFSLSVGADNSRPTRGTPLATSRSVEPSVFSSRP